MLLRRNGIFFLVTIIVGLTVSTQAQEAQNLLNGLDHRFFIENKGQWPGEVKYLCKTGSMNAWITDKGVVYDYYQIIKEDESQESVNPHKRRDHRQSDLKRTHIKGHRVRTLLSDANTNASKIEKGQRAEYQNYFIGNDPSRWASYVRLYDEIEMQDIYPGIDTRYYYDNNQLRYDYNIEAGANPSQIQFQLEGADDFQVTDQGELLIKTSLGEVMHGKIRAYQRDHGIEQDVTCRFEMQSNGMVGINAVDYDQKKPLIVDPLVYSTFLGGSDVDEGYDIALDNSGNVYLTGEFYSINYPTTSGAYEQVYNGEGDVFVTKLNTNESALIYSTFLGGSDSDWGNSIAVDDNGNVYVTGNVLSTDYPTTSGAYDQGHNGGYNDVFITKLNASGSALVYSTFLGGSGSDWGSAIVVDNNGNVHVTGSVNSSDYPTTSGAYNQNYNGGRDVFVTKLNANGSALVYSTFLGGSADDSAYDIALDDNENIYVTGDVYSTDYPTTSGAYDRNHNGNCDIFTTKLNTNSSALVYSTFLGGSVDDFGNSIAVDNSGNVYVTGGASSTDYPTTSGAYDQSFNGGYEAVITKLNVCGSVLVYSNFLGGSGDEWGHSIAVDNNGNVYVTGETISSDYPTTDGAYDQSFNGDWDSWATDAFIAKLNTSGSSLVYSTFLGGSDYDWGSSIAVDNSGNVYVAGYTGSVDYPTTGGAYNQIHYGGYFDVFVTKLDFIQDIAINLSFWNYDTIKVGSHSDKTFIVSNIGNTELDVTATTLTGMNASEFSIQSGSGVFSLAPSGSREIVVRFNPTTIGDKSASLEITSNNPDESSLLIALIGTGEGLITLVSPNGGENFSSGNEEIIEWQSTDVIDINLFISYNNGASWDTIATNIPSTGTYSWTVPYIATRQGLIKIEDVNSPSMYDISDAVFTIKTEFISGIDVSSIPTEFTLRQNYPNPFNAGTWITYGLPLQADVKLMIYNVQGQCLCRIQRDQDAGYHSFYWDGIDRNGNSVVSGTYICNIKAKGESQVFSESVKMFLLK